MMDSSITLAKLHEFILLQPCYFLIVNTFQISSDANL